MRAPDLEEMVQDYEKGAADRQALRAVIALVQDTPEGRGTFWTLIGLRSAARHTFANFLIVQYATDKVFDHMRKKRTCLADSHILGDVWVENAQELLNEWESVSAYS